MGPRRDTDVGEQIPYLGQFFAILTAISWAFAVILFKKSGETVHPVALNFFKNLVAMVLLIPTIFLFGEPVKNLFTNDEYMLLLLSGALGIGIADTLFFKSLNLLGAGLSAIVDCMYSPSIIILAFLWLGETLSIAQFVGIVVIVSAVLTISKMDNGKVISKHDLISGILLGILAMATMAVGVVIVKPILDRSPILWLTEVRLLGGIIILILVLLFHPGRRKIISPRLDRQSWAYTISGSFIGAYVAMVLWLAGMKYTKASIAAALNQTANIFIFIFAAWLLKEPITPRRIVGIILGVAGAFMVTFG